MRINHWDINVPMLEHPTESQCPGTPSAETATADTCIMPACTVHITPVNNIHTHTHNCHMHPNVNTTHKHTHSTIHNANHLNHLLTLHPPPPITLKDIHTTHPHPHSNHHLTHPSVINVNTTDTLHTLTPADIHDLLTPHLLHQHSLLSAVHALLPPLPPTSPISLPTLNTLYRILQDSPRHIAMLPPLP